MERTSEISKAANDGIQKLLTYNEDTLKNYRDIIHLIKSELPSECSQLLSNIVDRVPFDEIKNICEQNTVYFKRLNTEIDDLKKRKKELENLKISQEDQINGYEQEITHLQEKQKNLQKKRDEIMAYKLLTNTNFVYNSRNIKGYVVGNTPDQIKCFDLNPQKYSTEQITQKIYSVMKEVCSKSIKINEEGKEKLDSPT